MFLLHFPKFLNFFHPQNTSTGKGVVLYVEPPHIRAYEANNMRNPTKSVKWAGVATRYIEWSGDRIPVDARFSAPVQTSPGTHRASCTVGQAAAAWR